MILTLAALAVTPAPGCRTVGSSVQCILAAPTAAMVVAPPPPKPRLPLAPERAHRAPLRPARVAVHTPKDGGSTPADAAGIARHIASLVAISDCTGARTYAAAAGDAALAERTFAGCIGRPAPAGLPSGPVPVDTVTRTEPRAAPVDPERPS